MKKTESVSYIKTPQLESKTGYYKNIGEKAAVYTFTKNRLMNKKLDCITPKHFSNLSKSDQKKSVIDINTYVSSNSRDISHLKDKIISPLVKINELPSDIETVKKLLENSDSFGNPLKNGLPVPYSCRKPVCMEPIYQQYSLEVPTIDKIFLGSPSGRQECSNLKKWLDNMKETYCSSEDQLDNSRILYTMCSKEITRQVTVHCSERGEILQEIFDFFINHYEKMTEKVVEVQEKAEKLNKVLTKFYKDEEKNLMDEQEKFRNKNTKLVQIINKKKAKILNLKQDLEQKNKLLEEYKDEYLKQKENSLRAVMTVHRIFTFSNKSKRYSFEKQSSVFIKNEKFLNNTSIETQTDQVIKKLKKIELDENQQEQEIVSGYEKETQTETQYLEDFCLDFVSILPSTDKIQLEVSSQNLIKSNPEIEKPDSYIDQTTNLTSNPDGNYLSGLADDLVSLKLQEDSSKISQEDLSKKETEATIPYNSNQVFGSKFSDRRKSNIINANMLAKIAQKQKTDSMNNLTEIDNMISIKKAIYEQLEKKTEEKLIQLKSLTESYEAMKNNLGNNFSNPIEQVERQRVQNLKNSESLTEGFEKNKRTDTNHLSPTEKNPGSPVSVEKGSEELKNDLNVSPSIFIEDYKDPKEINLDQQSSSEKSSDSEAQSQNNIEDTLSPKRNRSLLANNQDLRGRRQSISILNPNPEETEKISTNSDWNIENQGFLDSNKKKNKYELTKEDLEPNTNYKEDDSAAESLNNSMMEVERATRITELKKKFFTKHSINSLTEIIEFHFSHRNLNLQIPKKSPAKKIMFEIMSKKPPWVKKRATMSRKMINKLTYSIYLAYYTKQDYSDPLLDFLYDDFSKRFGFKKVVEKKFKEFICSMIAFQDSRRSKMFLRFISGGKAVNLSNFSSNGLDLYLSSLNFMTNSKIGMATFDDSLDKIMLPLVRATECLREYMECIDKHSITKAISYIEKAAVADPRKINPLGLVENELVLEILVENYESNKLQVIKGVELLLNSIKYNEPKDSVTKYEASLLFRSISPSKFDDLDQCFIDKDEISIEDFCETCIAKLALSTYDIFNTLPDRQISVEETETIVNGSIEEYRQICNDTLYNSPGFSSDFWDNKISNVQLGTKDRDTYETILALHIFSFELHRLKNTFI